jgi:hypothetical protein
VPENSVQWNQRRKDQRVQIVVVMNTLKKKEKVLLNTIQVAEIKGGVLQLREKIMI